MNPHPLQPYWTEKAKDAMREKANSGVLPGCAPLGYKNVEIEGEKVIVPDLITAAKVRNLFLLAESRKYTLRGILPLVEAMGLRSRNGKQIGLSALYTILTNPFYMGRLRYKGELIRGTQAPLVHEKLFERVQQRMSKDSTCRRK